MRILAALTVFISVSISSFSLADPVELQWEYEVDPNRFLRGSTLVRFVTESRPRGSAQGGCVASIQLTNPRAPSGSSFIIFTLQPDGSLEWKSPPLDHAPRVVRFQKDILVYRFSSATSAADPDGNSQYFYVPLGLGRENLNETPLPLNVSRSALFSHNPIPNPDKFFFASTTAAPEVYHIQKWVIPSASPQLAGSSFGIEDGNLILSWPTTAGQTYQVQRSTDLQSWEDIGVALTGNGTTMSYSQPSNAAKIFLRVVIP